MDNTKLYYTPARDTTFNEVKEKSIEIWKTYDDEYGYATEKVNGIKDLKNVGDNLMYIVSQFDHWNKIKLSKMLSLEASNDISIRMIAGGYSEEYDSFNIWMRK